MKKSTYFITVSVMSILICLISGALYAYCKDINIHNYSLDKINSKFDERKWGISRVFFD